MTQPMSIYWPLAATGIRVQTRLAGITKAARVYGFNRSHLQKCAAGKRPAGKKTLANMALIGIGGKGVAV